MKHWIERQKKLIPALAFWAVLVLGLVAGSRFFKSYAIRSGNGQLLRRSSIEAEMQQEKENSLDVLVLGDSESYTSVSPMQLWMETGIPSFTAGQSGQTPAEAVSMLGAALEKQSPGVVLLETNLLYRSRGSIDGLQDILANQVSDCLPIFQYHTVWKDAFGLEKEEIDSFKGYHIRAAAESFKGGADYMNMVKQKEPIPWLNKLTIEQLVCICRSKDIELIFYSAPSPKNYNIEKHRRIQEFADELGVSYLDLNEKADEIGIDWIVDTLDAGDHMNVSGAEKTTTEIGRYLKERTDLKDRREDPAYQDWNREAAEYEEAVRPEILRVRASKGK